MVSWDVEYNAGFSDIMLRNKDFEAILFDKWKTQKTLLNKGFV